MQKFLRGMRKPSTIIPLAAMVIVTFLSATQFLSAGALSIITAAIALAVTGLILVSYIPTMIYTVRHDHPVAEQNILIGVIILFTDIASWNLWRITFVLLERPEWMISHWAPSLMSLVASMTGFYFLTVPGLSGTGLRYTTLALIGACVFAAVGLMIFDSL